MLSWITGAVEIFGFLAFWAYDALLELFYLIFRCRPMKNIKKENILLTGTGQGLGRLITERLAKDGNILHCVDINMELNNKLKEDFKNADCTIYVYQCDVGNLDAVRKLGEEIKKNVSDRHISYLFNIAGIVMGKTFGDLTEGQLKKTMDVNVMGLLYLQKLVYPEMVQNNGHIINISSLAGLLAGPMIVDYATSKFAVTGMSQGLNMEMSYLGIKNVKVTSVHPHVTKTGMFNNCVAKWNIVFPLLEPNWVADQIIIGTKEEREMLILPKITNINLAVLNMMSPRVQRAYCEMLGNDMMKGFKKIRVD